MTSSRVASHEEWAKALMGTKAPMGVPQGLVLDDTEMSQVGAREASTEERRRCCLKRARCRRRHTKMSDSQYLLLLRSTVVLLVVLLAQHYVRSYVKCVRDHQRTRAHVPSKGSEAPITNAQTSRRLAVSLSMDEQIYIHGSEEAADPRTVEKCENEIKQSLMQLSVTPLESSVEEDRKQSHEKATKFRKLVNAADALKTLKLVLLGLMGCMWVAGALYIIRESCEPPAPHPEEAVQHLSTEFSSGTTPSTTDTDASGTTAASAAASNRTSDSTLNSSITTASGASGDSSALTVTGSQGAATTAPASSVPKSSRGSAASSDTETSAGTTEDRSDVSGTSTTFGGFSGSSAAAGTRMGKETSISSTGGTTRANESSDTLTEIPSTVTPTVSPSSNLNTPPAATLSCYETRILTITTYFYVVGGIWICFMIAALARKYIKDDIKRMQKEGYSVEDIDEHPYTEDVESMPLNRLSAQDATAVSPDENEYTSGRTPSTIEQSEGDSQEEESMVPRVKRVRFADQMDRFYD